MKAILLGDIHGDITPIPRMGDTPLIQLGDFGFAAAYEGFKDVPKETMMIIGGNHDEYPILKTLASYLGDFGLIPGTKKTFFIRGAHSIDKEARLVRNWPWWPEEELTTREADMALDAYERAKPEVVLSHTCPDIIVPSMWKVPLLKSFTGQLLNECLKIHTPRRWYFGHWHEKRQYRWGDTCIFRCVGTSELLEVDLP